MDPGPDDTVRSFATAAELERWLAKHHAKAGCLWIKYAKRESGLPSVTWTEAVDVALCYGWIDGQAKSLDDTHYLQRFTPRRATSKWSKINRERVARLIHEGRMQPAGLAEIERAKADGRWDAAYDSPRTAEVPADLAAALAKHPVAQAAFAKLTGMNRYTILYRLHNAKQPQTRARHIEAFIATLAPARKAPAGAKRRT
jgi:uncharacterized protein YdeI (YjbR/CyaY-like superfamily)